MPDTIRIWTIAELHREKHRLGPWCPKCQAHRDWIDLDALIRRGFGDVPPRDVPFSCPECGTRMKTQLHPPDANTPRSHNTGWPS